MHLGVCAVLPGVLVRHDLARQLAYFLALRELTAWFDLDFIDYTVAGGVLEESLLDLFVAHVVGEQSAGRMVAGMTLVGRRAVWQIVVDVVSVDGVRRTSVCGQ